MELTLNDKQFIMDFMLATQKGDLVDGNLCLTELMTMCPVCQKQLVITGFVKYKLQVAGRGTHSIVGIRSLAQGKCEHCAVKVDRVASWTFEELEAAGINVRPKQ